MQHMAIRILPGDFSDPQIMGLLETHFISARGASPPGSAHAFDIGSLQRPEITFWAAWEDRNLAAVGALMRIAPGHGEIKSMHTAAAMRGRGVGSLMLRHIVASAREKGFSRLSLETGAQDFFIPARALYARHGFKECQAFGSYRPDPNSIFMTLALCDR